MASEADVYTLGLRLRLRLRCPCSHVWSANSSAIASARKWRIVHFLHWRLHLCYGSSHVYLLAFAFPLAFAFASHVWTRLKQTQWPFDVQMKSAPIKHDVKQSLEARIASRISCFQEISWASSLPLNHSLVSSYSFVELWWIFQCHLFYHRKRYSDWCFSKCRVRWARRAVWVSHHF